MTKPLGATDTQGLRFGLVAGSAAASAASAATWDLAHSHPLEWMIGTRQTTRHTTISDFGILATVAVTFLGGQEHHL